jgi:transcriptional regulator of arginine metabolism
MYKRVSTTTSIRDMMQIPGFISIHFSGNMAVIKTHTGYASALAWNIDRSNIPCILGTVAGGDTIFIVIKEGVSHQEVINSLKEIVPNMK